MIGEICVRFINGEYYSWTFARDFYTPFAEFLDIARSVAVDYCNVSSPYVYVTVEVGNIRRCVARYWYYCDRGVISNEKTI